MTLSQHDLLDLARAAFAARGLPFDGEPSVGLTFTGDVVVLGLEGGEAHDPHEECSVLARAEDLQEGLRSALWRATLRHEALCLAHLLPVEVARIFAWDALIEEQCVEVLEVSASDHTRLLGAGVIGAHSIGAGVIIAGPLDWEAVDASPLRDIPVVVRSTAGPDRRSTLAAERPRAG
jgi:hypothetical protein